MGGCVVPFCHNSSAKGYKMKIFPKNPQRRAQWAKNIGREDWKPTDHSYICEVHFTPEMWESNRCDNARKLKQNAVPTIFTRQVYDFETGTQSIATVNLLDEEDEMTVNENLDTEISPVTGTECNPCKTLRQQLDNSAIRMKKLETKVRKLLVNRIKLQKNNDILRYRLSILQKKNDNDKYRKILHKVFTEDQVQALFTKSQRARNWSDETIHRALKFKFACGTNGYEEICRQGIPLPKLRTLRYKLGGCKFDPSIADQLLKLHESEII